MRGENELWSGVVYQRRRNIPACAGKTRGPDPTWWSGQEHPRVRGENIVSTIMIILGEGTSPRARGKLFHEWVNSMSSRNIPACAGKTQAPTLFGWALSEHPRVRGENLFWVVNFAILIGTSPRARGKPSSSGVSPDSCRNIPACAGKTCFGW